MTFEIGIALISVCAIITTIAMQIVKKFIAEKQNVSYNLVTLGIGMAVGIAVTAVYYLYGDIAYTSKTIVAMIIIGVFSAGGAMYGYDKIVQAIKQIHGIFGGTTND